LRADGGVSANLFFQKHILLNFSTFSKPLYFA
jgi:hypothetical protein